jgi:hypothetical protein
MRSSSWSHVRPYRCISVVDGSTMTAELTQNSGCTIRITRDLDHSLKIIEPRKKMWSRISNVRR